MQFIEGYTLAEVTHAVADSRADNRNVQPPDGKSAPQPKTVGSSTLGSSSPGTDHTQENDQLLPALLSIRDVENGQTRELPLGLPLLKLSGPPSIKWMADGESICVFESWGDGYFRIDAVTGVVTEYLPKAFDGTGDLYAHSIANPSAAPLLAIGNEYLIGDTTVYAATAPVVVGSSGDDEIAFALGASSGEVDIFLNGLLSETILGATQLVAYGGRGNDLLKVQSSLTVAANLFGQAGNDTLVGGSGDDILSGGDGIDILFGRAGHDYVVGGAGLDILFGGRGNDLLITSSGIASSACHNVAVMPDRTMQFPSKVQTVHICPPHA